MKTVSTKLDKRIFEKFQEMCNHEGQCMSESLRDLIQMDIEAYEDGLELEPVKQQKIEPTKISEAKLVRISYDDGKTWINLK